MKVLIIDDSPVYRLVIRRELQLTKEDDYFEAGNGDEGIKILQENPKISIITLDVEMPGMDGYETCRRIREYECSLGNSKDGKTRRTPIIFLTATDTVTGRVKGFESGASDFISKSFQKGELRIAVRKILFPEKRLSGVRALIVDSHNSARHMTSHFLSQIGVEVLEANDGKHAYEIMEQQGHELDLLITEQDLPNLNGQELCRRVRTELGLRTIPMILVTEDSDRSKMLEFFQSGGTDYLVKPYFKEELLARLHVHLEIQLLYNNLEKNLIELQNLDRLKDQFLAACSHDLRGPLNGILGFAAILLEDPSLKPEQQEGLGIIKSSGLNLLNLINDLLDISQIQLQKEELKLKEISLTELIQKSINSYKSMAQSKSITITQQASKVGQLVYVDPSALIRVTNNLISNAIKFTERKGEVKVTETYHDDGSFEFSIKDSGIGIPKDQIPNLFNQFSKAGRTGTEGEQSTGLGLNIVMELIKKHRGTIDVTSAPGQGTTFLIRIPNLKPHRDHIAAA